MDKLIAELYDIIKDHRSEENFMSLERVKKWIMQFDAGDRNFVLEETIHIFKQRYISKEDGKNHVRAMLQYLMEKYEFSSVKEFISEAFFVNNLEPEKSQNILLEFLNDILMEEFETSLDACNSITPKYIIYLDDILCTGQTVIKGLTDSEIGWFNQIHPDGGTNYEYYETNEATLVLAYLAVHNRCANKLRQRLYYKLNKKNISRMIFVYNMDFKILNDLDEKDATLNFMFPTSENLNDRMKDCQKVIENKLENAGYINDPKLEFRNTELPTSDPLFSSAENRNRFEKIILDKSIEYYNDSLANSEKTRPRPLGYGLHSDLGFGFGTLIFTWRNVPYNTPLVFWYPYHGRSPLFERIFT